MTKLLMMLSLTTSVALSGCADPYRSLKPVPIAAQCGAFKVIRPDRSDTTDTKRQVLAHNLAYRGLKCPENK